MANYLELEPLSGSHRELFGENFKHSAILFYFFPVRIILFTVVHSCNCWTFFFLLKCHFHYQTALWLQTVQCYPQSLCRVSSIVLFLHTGLEGGTNIVYSFKKKGLLKFINTKHNSSASLLMTA